MRNRIKISLIFSLMLLTFECSFSQTYPSDLGVSTGFSAMVNNQGSPSLFMPKTSINFCYSPDLKNGIRTGISYSNNIEGCNALIEIPVYYSFKTKKETSKGIQDAESISGLISNIIATFIPRRVEFNVGPSFGFINRYSNYQKVSPVSNSYFSNEFVGDRNFIFSLDVIIRPSYVIGRVNISVGLGAGYLFSKNYIYSSDNSNFQGLRPTIQLKGDIGISFSF
jgi:hypothetical protein